MRFRFRVKEIALFPQVQYIGRIIFRTDFANDFFSQVYVLEAPYAKEVTEQAKDYTESLTLSRSQFLMSCIQHDTIALCEPVIILYGLISVTLAAWSLSFSSAACIIFVEWIIVLLMEQRVVTDHLVLFRLNGWLFD